ncbi:MAG: hypothetical protein U0641_01160 [Anaerolineae bacterium]
MTDPRGNTTTYTYDGETGGWPTRRMPPSQTASYTYDADGNRTMLVDKRGNATRAPATTTGATRWSSPTR